MITKINNIGDVIAFTEYLNFEGTNAHPDDDFHDYINISTGTAIYTTEQAALRNDLMKQCFKIAGLNGRDLYNCDARKFT